MIRRKVFPKDERHSIGAKIVAFYLENPEMTLRQMGEKFNVCYTMVSKEITKYFKMDRFEKEEFLSKANNND